MKKKIIFLPENYFPKVSGVPVVVKYLSEGLLARGYQVQVATTSFKGEPLHDYINGVEVFRFKMYKNFFHQYKGDVLGYIDFVKNSNADILIFECSQCITTDVLLPHIKKLPGKKIFHSHGFSGMEIKPFSIKPSLLHTIGNTHNWLASKWYFNYTLKKAMPFFNASMCLSKVDSSKDYLERYCEKSFILDNAADNMFFSDDVIDNKLFQYVQLKNEKYMMCCANYTYVKNQKDMLEQYYKSKSSKNVSLVCIGSRKTPYYFECVEWNKQLAMEYGERDVHLLQGVQREDIPPIMKGASLYLVTSRYEQYSISIIEAMSQGVPFISMNTGNARVLPGGITINNVDEMHETIDSLLSDTEAYKKYSILGKKFAYDNCRIDAVVDKLDNIIQSI